MPGEHQRRTQNMRQPRAHITGIRIVTVQDVGKSALLAEPGEQVIRQRVEVIPQLFFGDIVQRVTIDAHNTRAGA